MRYRISCGLSYLWERGLSDSRLSVWLKRHNRSLWWRIESYLNRQPSFTKKDVELLIREHVHGATGFLIHASRGGSSFRIMRSSVDLRDVMHYDLEWTCRPREVGLEYWHFGLRDGGYQRDEALKLALENLEASTLEEIEALKSFANTVNHIEAKEVFMVLFEHIKEGSKSILSPRRLCGRLKCTEVCWLWVGQNLERYCQCCSFTPVIEVCSSYRAQLTRYGTGGLSAIVKHFFTGKRRDAPDDPSSQHMGRRNGESGEEIEIYESSQHMGRRNGESGEEIESYASSQHMGRRNGESGKEIEIYANSQHMGRRNGESREEIEIYG